MARVVLAVDPGNVESGWIIISGDTYAPLLFEKSPTRDLITVMRSRAARREIDISEVVVEQIGHYGTGMSAGATVFDTCRVIGRVEQVADDAGLPVTLIKRATVKAHICGSASAKDGNVAQALADRFAPGRPNKGKGTKDTPGWFYGFAGDVWQAYALGVAYLDGVGKVKA